MKGYFSHGIYRLSIFLTRLFILPCLFSVSVEIIDQYFFFVEKNLRTIQSALYDYEMLFFDGSYHHFNSNN